MTRKINKSFGFVRLKLIRTGMWQLQYREPESGKYRRRRFPADTYAEADELARAQNDALKAERGLLPSVRQSPESLMQRVGPTVKEAMIECINASRSSSRTKRDYVSCANIFLRWLPERFPKLTHWRQIRPLHLNEFVKDLEKDGKAHATIRLYLLQVKATARYMALNYADRGFTDIGATVKTPQPPPQAIPQVLQAVELDALLQHLEEGYQDILPMALLQSLCGLRIREVVMVLWIISLSSCS